MSDVGVAPHGLDEAMAWLGAVIDARMRLNFGNPSDFAHICEIPAPWRLSPASRFAELVATRGLDLDSVVVLCLALAPYLRPQLLDAFHVKNPMTDRPFTEFGGVAGSGQEGFRPTLQTAAFLVAGADLDARIALPRLLSPDHPLQHAGLVRFESQAGAASIYSTAIEAGTNSLRWLDPTATNRAPLSVNFPARRVTTALEWTDLVLSAAVLEELDLIQAWLDHRDTLAGRASSGRVVKPGYRTLFHGPPGAGKTATACLLGKRAGLDVYRVDLSLVISKWIGETEKNLGAVFEAAEAQGWILFFDEADALFGKRTATESAHDRYANQEIAFLLQRVEDFPGLVILATNIKANIDAAFARRFQSMIYFGVPDVAERAQLWKRALADLTSLESDIDVEAVAKKYELTGGAIVNVVQYALLRALRQGHGAIGLADLENGVRREFRKEGKTL